MIKKILFILYILILVCMAAASIVEKTEGTDYAHVHYYGAWWFILIWAALAALGIFYLIQRKVKAVSTWVLHLSFVIILVGAFITHVNGKQGMMHLRIGEPSDIYFSNNPAEGIQQRKLPFTLSLQKFNIHLYEGTNVVRDYSSQFLVTDHYEMKEAKVSLNKIYTHGSYRFYQASYDEDGMGSVLAINSDPFGIPVTYCGYFLLFASLVWILFDKKGGYRKLLKRSYQQFRNLLIVIFSLVGIGFIFLIYHFSHIDFSTGERAPILNSPYFCLHVSVIMMSYVLLILTCLCGILGICWRSRQERMRDLSHLFLYPALTTMGFGIFIGAIWANVSWGNYWSWDSKETWALITFMIYAVVVHTQSLPVFRKPLVYHIYITLAFMSIAMTYFGVNNFLTGMHSYA
ncbi:MAG: cytochrome c biogenesis protein CcsA [Segatella copri]|nr:cytochrome c biogenesis protein CcsA [Segatella copri]